MDEMNSAKKALKRGILGRGRKKWDKSENVQIRQKFE